MKLALVYRTALSRPPLLLISMAVLGVVMLCLPNMMPARFIWNVTASAPRGIYAVSSDSWRVGDRVAVKPGAALAEDLDMRGILPRGKLLIKRIVAGQSDVVCRAGANITVNGVTVAVAKASSGSGAPLPVWNACRHLTAEDVFLLGETDSSYDGRYFGPTSAGDVLGSVELFVPF